MKDSLYSRIGGYDQFVRVLDAVCNRMMRDDRLGVYFRGQNTNSKRRLTQNFANFLCEQAGGPVSYGGPDVKAAHQGLRISREEWEIFCTLFKDAAETHKLPARETADVLELVRKFEKDIVEEE
jgi:hemoglobin